MCDIFLKMDSYFDECLTSDNRIEELLRGESSCFDQTLITNDEVFDSLVQPWEHAALNISTGPLALRTFQTAGPVRASTLYLSLALQDHRVKCRASRLKITVACSMTNFATFSCILFLKFRYACIA